MVTIKDIARESGYSISTVSRVLNNRNDVSFEAKKKIEETVEKFHFVPNNNAKHLKQTNTKAIGMIVRGTLNMLFANIVAEIQSIVERTDYTLLIYYLKEEEKSVEQALQICRERKPAGLLFLGANPECFEEEFARIDIPCVLVSNRANTMTFDNLSSVSIDDRKAAQSAIDKLFEAGHEKIGILGGSIERSYTSFLRYQGCEDSFKVHHSVFDPNICFEEAGFSFEGAYKGMERLIKKYPNLTAVFAMSDVMAIGAIRALVDKGYQIPRDISIIGFDGTVLAEYYHPKLATIKQQYRILAIRGVEILFGQIEWRKEPIHELVPFEFINGESVRIINNKI